MKKYKLISAFMVLILLLTGCGKSKLPNEKKMLEDLNGIEPLWDGFHYEEVSIEKSFTEDRVFTAHIKVSAKDNYLNYIESGDITYRQYDDGQWYFEDEDLYSWDSEKTFHTTPDDDFFMDMIQENIEKCFGSYRISCDSCTKHHSTAIVQSLEKSNIVNDTIEYNVSWLSVGEYFNAEMISKVFFCYTLGEWRFAYVEDTHCIEYQSFNIGDTFKGGGLIAGIIDRVEVTITDFDLEHITLNYNGQDYVFEYQGDFENDYLKSKDAAYFQMARKNFVIPYKGGPIYTPYDGILSHINLYRTGFSDMDIQVFVTYDEGNHSYSNTFTLRMV